MKKQPTNKQIEAEIAKLQEMKPHVRQKSAFGDNHHDAIDAMINVLQRRWSTTAVHDEYPYASGEEDVEEVPENVHSSALEAAEWLEDCSERELPSSGYEGLDTRKRKEVKHEETRVRPVPTRGTVRGRSGAGRGHPRRKRK